MCKSFLLIYLQFISVSSKISNVPFNSWRVHFNKGGLCNLILFSAHKQGQKKQRKRDRSAKSKMPLPRAVPGAAPPSTAGKQGCSLCHCIWEHTKVFYVISSIQILACNKTGTLDARLENQSAREALHAQGWGWAGAGPGLSWVLGGCGAGKYPEITFPSQSVLHLSFPFSHLTLMGSKTLSAQTLTSSAALIKLFICTSSCDFFLIHLLKNNFFPSSSSSSISGPRWAADTS